MKKLRVAGVGAGYFAQFHLAGWQAIAEVDYVALCDRDEAKARAYAERFGIPRVFTDCAQMLDAVAPDLFDIVTPPPTHAALVAEAARRKLPAICQKALAPTYAEAVALVETAERAGALLVAHENIRWSPWYREAKRLIDGGTFGRLLDRLRLRPGDGQGP
ncbi:MAG: Gfo/Idh/MocA family protein, partial [Bacteroidota bacterium]